jgi:hypothetical protein
MELGPGGAIEPFVGNVDLEPAVGTQARERIQQAIAVVVPRCGR